MAAELGVPFVQTAGPALERKGDVAAFLTALEPRSVFFVDEVHRLPRALEETFYPAMEDSRLPITVGQGAGARVVTLDLPPFTLDRRDDPRGPAHDAAARPLRDPAPPRALRPDDLGRIVRRSAAILEVEIDDEGAPRSPSAAAARRAWRTGCSSGCATTREVRADGASPPTSPTPRSTCSRSTARGSTASTGRSCGAVCEKFAGGPVGLSTLAVAVGEEPDTIEDVYEPYLLQSGFSSALPEAGRRRPGPGSTSGSSRLAKPRCSDLRGR